MRTETKDVLSIYCISVDLEGKQKKKRKKKAAPLNNRMKMLSRRKLIRCATGNNKRFCLVGFGGLSFISWILENKQDKLHEDLFFWAAA